MNPGTKCLVVPIATIPSSLKIKWFKTKGYFRVKTKRIIASLTAQLLWCVIPLSPCTTKPQGPSLVRPVAWTLLQTEQVENNVLSKRDSSIHLSDPGSTLVSCRAFVWVTNLSFLFLQRQKNGAHCWNQYQIP